MNTTEHDDQLRHWAAIQWARELFLGPDHELTRQAQVRLEELRAAR